jgi:hypothetical protein
MRPGRMKYKARARRRRVAVTAAGVGALTVLGGTAYASEGGGSWHKEDPTATLDNSGNATNNVEQESKVHTDQDATANTGGNGGLIFAANVNIGDQDCTTSLDGGNLSDVEEESAAGNNGGNCDNASRQTNRGTADASIDTGDANANNDSKTTVRQKNSGHASVANTATDNQVGDDGNGNLLNNGDANLTVDQDSKVTTDQDAKANTGHNYLIVGVIGVNYGEQSGTTSVNGGNIDDAEDGPNTAGNTGGNASNDAKQRNNGTATANITTGNATASNSSKTTVNQTNSGNASVANTASGNTVGDD